MSSQGHRECSEPYDTVSASKEVFYSLLKDPTLPLPEAVRSLGANVKILGLGRHPTIPSPWKEAEAITALKALEAALAIALGRLRYPELGYQQAEIDSDHATAFLFMSYLSRIDGTGKWDSGSVKRLKPTDIYQAQSNLYRRLSANMYKTSVPDEYYHTHGSLDATPILNGLSLPGFLPEPLPSYDEICSIIQAQTQKHTPKALDDLTVSLKQSGCIVYRPNDFLATPQGRALFTEPLITCTSLETTSTPALFPKATSSYSRSSATMPSSTNDQRPQLLPGIKVLDLTRVIAGPSVTRTLAEHGASVIKVTSPTLPDVPYYQLDLNFGKRTVDLDLRPSSSSTADRARFEALLADVDVIVDGYRTGAMERLGYGPRDLVQRFEKSGRKKGFVYVRENCFGFNGPMVARSGWQPIADAISGLAWGHGRALGRNEPVLPPFPMSDYGTGEMGACAALVGLIKRAEEGGSWELGVSLTRWNLWVMSLGQYPKDVWERLKARHAPSIQKWKIGHLSNFDVVSKCAIEGMRNAEEEDGNGRFFGENGERFMFEAKGEGFGEPGVVKSCRPVVRLSGLRSGWRGTTRPNGWDRAGWW